MHDWEAFAGRGGRPPAKAEMYAVHPELTALCRIIGTIGVRAVEASLLRYISGLATALRAFVLHNRETLVRMHAATSNLVFQQNDQN